MVDVDDGLVSFERSFFSEKSEVLNTLNSLGTIAECNFEECFDRLRNIFNNYQEQPQLLGPHIEDLFMPLNNQLLAGIGGAENIHRLHFVCRIVQNICKVRGPKQCTKYFPHEVHQMEPCIHFLKSQDSSNFETWEVRYVLLLWLGNLSLIPFDISSLDSSVDGESLVSDLVGTAKTYLSESGPTREAAAMCLSSLLTRPDLQKTHLQVYLNWSLHFLSEYSISREVRNQFLYLGTLHTLTQIFKRGHRDRLLDFVNPALKCVLGLCDHSCQTIERKLLSKLIQRLGMALLPVREAPWRYQRGRRTLNLAHFAVLDTAKSSIETLDDELFDVPEVLEEVIENILQFLSDKDTIVRWSAAKGIGRVAMRLPKAFADEMVSAIVAFFNDAEDDCRWHGGCLALAELTRRGLLLPEKLAVVVPIVQKALYFDILKGQHGVGAHVRDAASYVCWSFARAYAPGVMRPFVVQLSVNMLCAVLFDREVNCRRAAAAAFQENVGRQGHENFAHGLEIIQIADYFSVGNRASCFLDHAARIGSLEGYFAEAFIEHLREHKIGHWDKEVRDLAAKAIAKILAISIETDVDALIANLAHDSLHPSLAVRHGSLLALARLLQILTSLNRNISPTSSTCVATFIMEMEKQRLFRGRGCELVREAACLLVESVAYANLDLPLKTQVCFVEFLNDQLRQPHELVQKAARDALRQSLFSFFGCPSKGDPTERLQKLTWRRYVDGLCSEQNVAATRGFALAIGTLPVRLLIRPPDVLSTILSALESFSDPNHRIAGEYDAETCRNAVESTREIFEKLCGIDELMNETLTNRFFSIFLRGCEDYNVDKRGDTGSWSRIASLRALRSSLNVMSLDVETSKPWVETCFGPAVSRENSFVSFTDGSLGAIFGQGYRWMLSDRSDNNNTVLFTTGYEVMLRTNSRVIDDNVLMHVYSQIVKQLAEKLDSVRQVAGEVLEETIEARRSLASMDMERFMCELLSEQSHHIINWARPDHVFPFVCRILQCPEFVEPVMQGIIISMGGLTESISKEATKALVSHCGEREPDFIRHLTKLLICMFDRNKKHDRIILPLLKSIEILFRNGLFNSLSSVQMEEWEISLHALLWSVLRTSTNIPKILTCIDILGILATSCVADKAKSSLANILGHRYPRVRKYAADLLYVVLVGLDFSNDIQSAIDMLIGTPWETLTREEAYEEKKRICELLQVDCKTLNSTRSGNGKSNRTIDELDSYGSLVRDAGY